MRGWLVQVGYLAMTQFELDPAEDRQQTNLPQHDAQQILWQMVSYHKDHTNGG